jgi:hypothetical protein
MSSVARQWNNKHSITWSSPRTGGFEYLHHSPESRTMRRKGNPVPGGITGPPCFWSIYRLGESRIWDNKIWSGVPRDLDQSISALVRTTSSCKQQTGSVFREGASHQHTRNCLSVMKAWSWASDGCLTPRQTDLLTVGRNVSLTLTIGREPSEACRQAELIDGEPPVIKELWPWISCCE